MSRFDQLSAVKAEAADHRGAAGEEGGGDEEEAGEGGGGRQTEGGAPQKGDSIVFLAFFLFVCSSLFQMSFHVYLRL